MDSKDWEWLVNNVFYTAKFLEISVRNSQNRACQQSMHIHRCGSKPHREVIYEMGGKDGNPPDVREVFVKTRKIDENIVEPETRKIYDELKMTMESEPTLTNLQVVERCFGRQRHGRVFGYEGGLKRKHFESTSQIEELKTKLHDKEEENRKLMDRLEQIENRLVQVENERVEHSDTNTSSNTNDEHQKGV
ncbi:uncharacterized protein [Euphorbia lathyris]|uniref:uncharacterized protein isoform X1 n=2 Tax=Euphorbia lathyris TaxID=212925 RepID=UPI003313728D